MLPIVKKFFIASLIYFILGLFVQVVAVFDVWLGFNPLAYTTVTAAGQILLMGWLTQLALALLYERWLAAAAPDSNSGLLVFVLLNLGLPLAIVGQPGLAILGGYWVGALATLGAILQLFAGVILGREVWIFFKEKQ